MDLQEWHARIEGIAAANCDEDGAHDLAHLRRVWENAREIMEQESGASPLVVLAACYLHDLVNLPKNHPDRAQASRMSGLAARRILPAAGYPPELTDAAVHAIEAHSFSAAIAPLTLEAKIVQDADRLDALGYVGLARMLYTAGRMGIRLAHGSDPLAAQRPLDDRQFSIDHIAVKLATLPDSMQTAAGRAIGAQRLKVLEEFRAGFAAEWR
jgi:uncharacterized protein